MMSTAKINLLIEYAKKEAELNKEFDREDGIDVNSNEYELNYESTKKRIETFIRYKEIRTKQYWYSMKFKDSSVKSYATGRNELDKQRRFLHNSALQSVLGFDKFAERFNLPKLYEGNLLTAEEIESHDSKAYDKRMEMTDFLFSLLNEIEDLDINMQIEESDKEYTDFMSNLKKQVEKVDRDYGVKSSIKKDESKDEKDNIEFYLTSDDERF